MTLHKAWSFNNWSDSEFQDRVDNISGTYITPSTDRFGTTNGALRIGGCLLFNYETTNPIIIGFSRKAYFTSDFSTGIIFYYESTAYVNARVQFSHDNLLQVFSYPSPSNNNSTKEFEMALICDNWHYFEIEFYPHSTSGYIDVHVDGVQVYYNDDADTWWNGYISQNPDGYNKSIYHDASTITDYMDDVYIVEVDATTPNDFIGPMHIETLSITANGTTNNGTASAGSNYECVDEVTANDDTDYVTLDAVDEIELYTISNLSITSGTIHAVLLNSVCRTVADEARAIQNMVRVNSTNYASGNDHYRSIEYDYLAEDIFLLNPDDSAAWEIADVNGMESGVKITA